MEKQLISDKTLQEFKLSKKDFSSQSPNKIDHVNTNILKAANIEKYKYNIKAFKNSILAKSNPKNLIILKLNQEN